MSGAIQHVWRPIRDLPPDWRALVDPDLHAFMRRWTERLSEIQSSRAYENFTARLRRQWAIETGVIERLYTLEEGITTVLIEHGLEHVQIPHEATDADPEYVLNLIRDQGDAIEGVYDFVSGGRPLGTSYIKELHQALTRHQDFYDAMDTLGNRVRRELPKGCWKQLPNNVEGPDGYRFEFCPPEHVDAEIDRLLEMHREHEALGVPPEVEAAWLHHRFTLIHPFTDGNGRVSRGLATLVLLKSRWLPLVVTRIDRAAYLAALRRADSDDLRPLVRFFGELQRRVVREAMSLSETSATLDEAIDAVSRRMAAGHDEREESASSVIHRVADALHEVAGTLLEATAGRLRDNAAGAAFRIETSSGASSDPTRSRWFHKQVAECAREHRYFANPARYHAWNLLEIRGSGGNSIELLFSFHPLGRSGGGILVCNAMAFTRYPVEGGSEGNEPGDLAPLGTAPFELGAEEISDALVERFREWMRDRITSGLNYWNERV